VEGVSKMKQFSISLTEEERQHLVFAVQQNAVGRDDKDSCHPEDYRRWRRLDKSLQRKLQKST